MITVYNSADSLLLSTENARGEGRKWFTLDGSTYVEAAAAAVDHHEVTAGGVKLYELGPNFTARGRLVDARARGQAWANGAAVSAQGFRYICDDTATEIPDLPGLKPFGDYTPHHFGGEGDGVTVDTSAIDRALVALPDRGVLRFMPGRTYLVDAPIEVTNGTAVVVDARGATIKCDDDSVWHIFKLGGSSEDDTDCEVYWTGGTFDGNKDNQRYYPNTDGSTIYTDQGEETYGAHSGTPFYENSAINGLTWDNGWINGTAGDGIDVNGGGNNGLIRVQHARKAVFQDIQFTNFVRNGIAAWNVEEFHATRISGTGQLPTTYFELVSLFSAGHEASLMKITGASENNIVNGSYPRRVFVSDCYSDGGVMPLFVRTNPPKSPASGISVKVARCQFYGIAREMWFEVCQSVTISDCDVTCSDYPNSTYRKDPAIFLGSGTQDWVVDNSYVYGRINTNSAQARRTGHFKSSVLIDYADSDQRSLECDKISDSYIESRSGGVLADRVEGSRLFLDDVSGSDSFKVITEIVNTEIGQERFEGTRERVTVAEDASTATLSGTPDAVQRVQIREMGFHQGRWYEVHSSDYEVSGSTIQLKSGSDIFTAIDGPVEVEVEWYANREDTLTTTGSLETTYTLTQTGGCRTQDILSITYNSVAVPHYYDITTPGSDLHFTSAMNSSGFMEITLVNATITEGHDLVVQYAPPLDRYRSLDLGSGYTRVDVTAVNCGGLVLDGGMNYISGSYTDIAGAALVRFKDGTELVDISDARANRLAGAFLCGFASTSQCNEARISGVHVKDWQMQTEYLQAEGDVLNAKAIGAIRSNGTQFLRRFMFLESTMEFSGKESGASTTVGNNQGGVLDNGYAARGGNLYLGVSALSMSVGSDSTVYAKDDLAAV